MPVYSFLSYILISCSDWKKQNREKSRAEGGVGEQVVSLGPARESWKVVTDKAISHVVHSTPN